MQDDKLYQFVFTVYDSYNHLIMTNEGPKQYPTEARILYGATVKKYEAGDILYELKGLKDGYGSDFRLGMTVSRQGDVLLVLEGKDPEESLGIQFNGSAKETKTPNMAGRLARIPRTLLEKDGKWLDDNPDFKVSSTQEDLSITKGDSSFQGYVRGIQGDGEQGTVMSLFIAGTGDTTIELFAQVGAPTFFRRAEMIFPSHAPTFYSGTLNELREAARDLIFPDR